MQSVLPRAAGVPWWGAILIAAGFTTVGAILDVQLNSSLGLLYNSFFAIGCVLAVLAVRRRALFTAAVQPPLITLVIGLLALYSMVLSSSDSAAPQGIRKAVLEVVLPFSNLFPWIVATFVLCGVIAVARWFTTRSAVAADPQARRAPTPPRASAKPATASAKPAAASGTKVGTAMRKPARPAGAASSAAASTTGAPARSPRPGTDPADSRRPAPSATQPSGRPAERPQPARPRVPRSTAAERPVPAERPGPAERPTAAARPTPAERPTPAPRRPASSGSRPVQRDPSVVGQGDRPVRRSQPQVIPPRTDGPRRTVGQLRDTGAIEDLTGDLDD